MPLRITIELVPRGNEKKKEKIAILDVENDGTGTETQGNYILRAQGLLEVSGENVGWDSWYGFPKRITGIDRHKGLIHLAKEVMKHL